MISTDEKSVADNHCSDIVTKFEIDITESQEKLPTFYWLPKLHKRPYKARFFANSSSCTSLLNVLCDVHVNMRVCSLLTLNKLYYLLTGGMLDRRTCRYGPSPSLVAISATLPSHYH